MARNFTITTPSETVRVGPDGRGEMSFTVTNVSGFPTRGLGKIVTLGNTNAEWLSLADVEREFPAGGVQQFRVAANIPPGTPAGRYTWRFDVVSAVKSGESSDLGPTVAFEVAASEPKKKGIPWWVWLAIAIAAIVIAVVVVLVNRKPPPPPPPPPVVEKVKVPPLRNEEFGNAILTLQNLGFTFEIEPRFVPSDPRMLIRGVNTVVDQVPEAGEELPKGSEVKIVVLRIRGTKFNFDDLKGVRLTPHNAKELRRFSKVGEGTQ